MSHEERRRLDNALQDAQGLVFDCDGTLLNTMPFYFEAITRTCKQYGLELAIDRFYGFAGMPMKQIFQELIDEQLHDVDAKPTAEECVEADSVNMKALEAEGKVAGTIDMVVDIVRAQHGKVPMAVASSSSREHVLAGLERNGILQLFDTVVTTCDEAVKEPKPAPDIFLVAARRIGVDPDHCVGFEDGDHGMKSIYSANFLYACDVRLLPGYPNNATVA